MCLKEVIRVCDRCRSTEDIKFLKMLATPAGWKKGEKTLEYYNIGELCGKCRKEIYETFSQVFLLPKNVPLTERGKEALRKALGLEEVKEDTNS